MAVIHHTTMHPSKLELLANWLPQQSWYAGTGELSRAGGFRLDDPRGEVGIELMVVATSNSQGYLVPMTYRGAPLDGAEHALIGTSEHGVLGTRWIYDGEHDPVLQAQLVALVRGEVVAQAQTTSDAVDPSVLVTPADAVAARIHRVMCEDETQPSTPGTVSVPWRRRDGSMARTVVASAT